MVKYSLKRSVNNQRWEVKASSDDRNSLQRKLEKAVEDYVSYGFILQGTSSTGTFTLVRNRTTIRMGVYENTAYPLTRNSHA